jgi:hypothetical protein
MPIAYVTDEKGDQETCFCIPGGIRINPIGALVLISTEEDGNITEGQIFAPGEWTKVTIEQDDT